MKKGWQTKPFEDCIESVKYTRKIQRKDFLDDGQFPIVSQEAAFTNGYWDDEADVFKVSTPVVIFGDHTQVLKYVDFDFVLGADGVKILPPRDFLRPKFFFYQLQAANFTSLGYARHYRLLKNLVIKYPPLAEQQRIVGLLDEAFEGLAIAKANAARNLQNARTLFESYLNSIDGPKVALGELVDIKSGDLDSNEAVKDGKYPFFTCSREPLAIDRYEFDCEAILLAGNNASADFNVKHFTGKFCARQRTYVITVRSNQRALCRFLYFELLKGLATFKQQAVGMTTKFIKLGMVHNLPIVLPSLDQQRLLVRSLDCIQTETQRLAGLYERKHAAMEALKKSLLHQAFTGAL